MASKNIVAKGATYNGVESVTFPVSGGGDATFYEVSDTTAAATDVASGKYFYTSSGVKTAGTASGGGGSSWTLLASDEVSVTTTSTTARFVKAVQCASTVYDKNVIIYVRIRDKAGKRAGYFAGSDSFYINYIDANSGESNLTYGCKFIHTYGSNSAWGLQTNGSTTGYGVYASSINADYAVNITSRYNSDSSLTIDGTYTIEVFKLDYPNGYPSVYSL